MQAYEHIYASYATMFNLWPTLLPYALLSCFCQVPSFDLCYVMRNVHAMGMRWVWVILMT